MDWCSVPRARAKRLKLGTARPTLQELKLFRLYRDRQVLEKPWRGWVLKPDSIVDPNGQETTRAQLQGYWLIVQFARELAREAGPETLDAYRRLLA